MLKYLKMMLIWILVLLFCSHSLCDTNNGTTCQKISGCRCVFPTGLGVDLSPVNDELLWFNVSMVDATFFFHPCSDLPFGKNTGEDDCTHGASACLFNKTTNKFHNLGSSLNATFLPTKVNENTMLYYSYKNITTAILLECAFVNQSSLFYIDAKSNNITYQLKLQSRWPCPMPIITRTSSASDASSGGLSTGSVLVIIFFVFVAIYFIGGAIVLKLLRGAEGKEMIPNYDFWVDLPSLVRDGTVFVVNGCQSTPSYDRI